MEMIFILELVHLVKNSFAVCVSAAVQNSNVHVSFSDLLGMISGTSYFCFFVVFKQEVLLKAFISVFKSCLYSVLYWSLYIKLKGVQPLPLGWG